MRDVSRETPPRGADSGLGDFVDDWLNGGFGIYIHWPFCEAKCPYCDFNSHVSRAIDHSRWERAYLSEIDRLRELTGERIVRSVFFGGGTPSLMRPEVVGKLLERIRERWPLANDLEVTLEANPSSVEAARFDGFRDAGVNRVSIGIQSLRDDHLRMLGRLHNAAEAIKAYDLARKIFPRVSFDLIYARQNQNLSDWRSELQEALDMAPEHLSLYQLTIEDGTAFGDRYRRGGLAGLPGDDLSADLFQLTQEMCDAAGMPAYEVSNHARDGEQSRHNLVYWRYGDYLGIGPGAHGRLTLNGHRSATQAIRMPNEWLDRVEQHGNGEIEPERLSHEDQGAEYLMMSLRLSEGSNLRRYERLAGKPLDQTLLDGLAASGHLWRDNDRIGATLAGRMVLNAILRQIL